ncbi:MAG TPA: hypothetical protein VH157_06980 [Bryobacteraceae bacterium]|jgi:hypothetical protein|nr:hypothetical protein [Bryobacteraceae bacterium]
MAIKNQAIGPLDYALQEELEAAIDRNLQHLSKGNAVDYAEYKWLCGEISGIRFAIRSLSELRGQIEKQDES